MSPLAFFRRRKNEKPEIISEHQQTSIEQDITIKETIHSLEIEKKKEFEINSNIEMEKSSIEDDIENEKEILEDYDPKLDLSCYVYPTDNLLKLYDTVEISSDEVDATKNKIITVCQTANIEVKAIKATVGVMDTLYEIVIKSGVRISTVMRAREDLAFVLASPKLKIEPIIEKGTIGIIAPNKISQKLSLHSIICSKRYQESEFNLPLIIGKNIFDESLLIDLTESPHILIAGTTGQGKSVLLNAMILSLLYKKHPAELKLVLFDMSKVEFNQYSRIQNHFLAKCADNENPIISNISDAVKTLTSLSIEMDERYLLLAKAGALNIRDYNCNFKSRNLSPRQGHKYLPYLVVIIDEYADLAMGGGNEVELPLTRLTQKAHNVGIHIILSTQRPSKRTISGSLKANFPLQIAFRMTSPTDSRLVIDKNGAETLSRVGEALYHDGIHTKKIYIPYTDTYDVLEVCNFISEQQGYSGAYDLPEFISSFDSIPTFNLDERDALFEEAARLVVLHQSGSTSLIQRKFSIGYNRAGRLMEQLEQYGIVGIAQGSKPRDVFISNEYDLEKLLSDLDS